MYRYKILDETGIGLRLFDNKQEAVRFLQDGWQMITLPKPNKYVEALKAVGEARL